MPYEKTEALCIRKTPFSNTSEVVTFFSPDRGRISMLSKGSHRIEGKRPPRECLLMARYEVVYVPRRRGLATFCSASILEHYRRLHWQLNAFLVGLYACEHANVFTLDNEPDAAYYKSLTTIMRQLDAGASEIGVCVVFLELAALASQGSVPAFDRCVRCGKHLEPREPLLFSAREGGIVCRACPLNDPQAVTVNAAVRGALLDVSGLTPATMDRACLAPELAHRVSGVLRAQIAALINRPLKMWKYLERPLWRRVLKRCREGAAVG